MPRNKIIEIVPRLSWGPAEKVTPEMGFDAIINAAIELTPNTNGKLYQCGLHGEGRVNDPRNKPDDIIKAVGWTLVEFLGGRNVCVTCALGETRSAVVTASVLVLTGHYKTLQDAFDVMGTHNLIKPYPLLVDNFAATLRIMKAGG